MSDETDLQDQLAGVNEVLTAYRRLVDLGLADDNPEARGLTTDGVSVLGDLLALARMQFGAGVTRDRKVAAATARAMLSALEDVIAELQGGSPSGAETQRLLAAAIREARS